MKIYGLLGRTHGAARVLTVMSPSGASAALMHMRDTDDLVVNATPGRLTRYLEQRSGALERLVTLYDIEILSNEEWNRRKQALGDGIW